MQEKSSFEKTTDSIKKASVVITETVKPVVEKSKLATESIKNMLVSVPNFDIKAFIPKFVDSVPNDYIRSYIDLSKRISSKISTLYMPKIEWIDSFDWTPIKETIKEIVSIANIKVDVDWVFRLFLSELYEAKWFPYALSRMNYSFMSEIAQINKTTRVGSKNRIKRIDKVVYSIYDEKVLKSIKKEWNSDSEAEPYIRRILCESIDAYNNKKYATTTITLTTLWEGIIYYKTNDYGRKNDRIRNKHFENLISETKYSDIFQSFYDDYIYYQCNSAEDVKEDVPGRNSIAHAFYKKYPSRKAALNAILITDFLLKLKPIEKAEDISEDQTS